MHRTTPRAVRGVAAFAAGALVLSLAACGSADPAPGPAVASATGGGSIDVVTRFTAGNSAAQAQKRVFDAFTAETGIKINLTEGLEAIDDQVETAVAADKSPDLVIVNLFDKTVGWLDAGVTVPVDQYVKDWGLADKMKPEALDEWRVGGVSGGQPQGLPPADAVRVLPVRVRDLRHPGAAGGPGQWVAGLKDASAWPAAGVIETVTLNGPPPVALITHALIRRVVGMGRRGHVAATRPP